MAIGERIWAKQEVAKLILDAIYPVAPNIFPKADA